MIISETFGYPVKSLLNINQKDNGDFSEATLPIVTVSVKQIKRKLFKQMTG
jgi:hypothetical protein